MLCRPCGARARVLQTVYASSLLSLPRLRDLVLDPLPRAGVVCCATLSLLDSGGGGGGRGPGAARRAAPLTLVAWPSRSAHAPPAFASFTGAQRRTAAERSCGRAGADTRCACPVTRALLECEGVPTPPSERRRSTVVVCVGSPSGVREAVSMDIGPHHALIVHWGSLGVLRLDAIGPAGTPLPLPGTSAGGARVFLCASAPGVPSVDAALEAAFGLAAARARAVCGAPDSAGASVEAALRAGERQLEGERATALAAALRAAAGGGAPTALDDAPGAGGRRDSTVSEVEIVTALLGSLGDESAPTVGGSEAPEAGAGAGGAADSARARDAAADVAAALPRGAPESWGGGAAAPAGAGGGGGDGVPRRPVLPRAPAAAAVARRAPRVRKTGRRARVNGGAPAAVSPITRRDGGGGGGGLVTVPASGAGGAPHGSVQLLSAAALGSMLLTSSPRARSPVRSPTDEARPTRRRGGAGARASAAAQAPRTPRTDAADAPVASRTLVAAAAAEAAGPAAGGAPLPLRDDVGGAGARVPTPPPPPPPPRAEPSPRPLAPRAPSAARPASSAAGRRRPRSRAAAVTARAAAAAPPVGGEGVAVEWEAVRSGGGGGDGYGGGVGREGLSLSAAAPAAASPPDTRGRGGRQRAYVFQSPLLPHVGPRTGASDGREELPVYSGSGAGRGGAAGPAGDRDVLFLALSTPQRGAPGVDRSGGAPPPGLGDRRTAAAARRALQLSAEATPASARAV